MLQKIQDGILILILSVTFTMMIQLAVYELLRAV